MRSISIAIALLFSALLAVDARVPGTPSRIQPRADAAADGRVVGGVPLKGVQRYPFFGFALSTKYPDRLVHGSLIGPRTVLTAASYYDYLLPANFITYSIDRSNNTKKATIYPIKSVKRHPKLNDNLDYDVAIWILGNPIQKGAYAPVYAELNRNASFPPNGVNAWVMGFGLTSTEDYEDTMTANEVWLPVFDQQKCANLAAKEHQKITPRMLCAGGVSGKDPCSGDVGNPLVVQKNGKWVQVGISSWTFAETCGKKGYPGVYTRVSSVMSWIDSIVKANGGYGPALDQRIVPTNP